MSIPGGEEKNDRELDQVAWNLPSPPPEHVRLPPDDSWPPWPFEAVKEPEDVRPAA